MWTTIVFGVTAVLFVSMAVAALVHQRWARRLPPLVALPATHRLDLLTTGQVRCSVIVAARDEEARLEETVRHLLAQEGVVVDVIVVDDRSSDRTGDILRRLASEDARVQARHVEVLPEGWLGKSFACHLGASAATAEWILFTDADCWLKTDVIARALQVADREAADHITLTPGVAAKTSGARAWHLALPTRLASRVSGVNRDRPGAHFRHRRVQYGAGIGVSRLRRLRSFASDDCR
jgi:glycosyltransferase involved in cell wall biosynthesis